MITPILEEMKKLDEPEILFVSAFSKAFDNELVGVRLGLDHLRTFNLPKDDLNCWKQSELLGELMGKTTELYIKSHSHTKAFQNKPKGI